MDRDIMTRIFIAAIAHETHGFNKFPTEIDAFEIEVGEEIRRNHEGVDGDSAWAGFFDAARKYEWDLVHPVGAFAMPSGPATKDTFEHLWQLGEAALLREGPYDGVIWFLHGGQMTEHLDDPEAEIVARTRAIVGPAVPIAVMLDIHANVSPELTENADIICGFHTTPHIDLRETAARTAGLMARTLSGEITPVTWSVHPPVLVGVDHGRTTDPECPFNTMLKRFEELQTDDPALLDVSFFSGFPFCDTRVTGASAVMVTNGTRQRFEGIIESFGNEIWRTRDFSSVRSVPMREAVSVARSTPGERPFLIGDWTDTPHGGGYGDSVNALKEMIAEGVTNAAFGPVFDPDTIRQAHEAGEGAIIEVNLGGRCAPERGTSYRGKALVKSNSPTGEYQVGGAFNRGSVERFGPSTCLIIENIDVVVTPTPQAIFDREQFRIFGINPEEKDIVVVKAYNHFRADFEPIGRGLIYADCGGIFTIDFSNFDYRKVRRPIHPLDEISQNEGLTFRAHTKIRQ
jgi:microcystin degradation protein MlrC